MTPTSKPSRGGVVSKPKAETNCLNKIGHERQLTPYREHFQGNLSSDNPISQIEYITFQKGFQFRKSVPKQKNE